jgi:hypothetical protein
VKAAGTDARGFRLLLAVVAVVQFQRLGPCFQSNESCSRFLIGVYLRSSAASIGSVIS